MLCLNTTTTSNTIFFSEKTSALVGLLDARFTYFIALVWSSCFRAIMLDWQRMAFK